MKVGCTENLTNVITLLPLQEQTNLGQPSAIRDGSMSVRRAAPLPVGKEEPRCGRSKSCQKVEKTRRRRSLDFFFSHFKELTRELTLVKRQNESLKKRYVEIEVHMKGNSGTEIISQKTALAEQLRSEIGRAETEGKRQAAQLEGLRKEYVRMQKIASAQFVELADTLHERVSSVDRCLCRDEDEGAKLEKTMGERKRRKADLNAENDSLGATIVRLSNEAQAKKTEAGVVEKRLREAEERLRAQAAVLAELDSKIAETTAQNSQLEAQKRTIKATVRKYDRALEHTNKKLRESQHRRKMSGKVHLVRQHENATLHYIYDNLMKSLNESRTGERHAEKQQMAIEECKRFVQLHQVRADMRDKYRENCRRRGRR